MIHAVRITGGLPGGAPIVLVSDGEETVLLCCAERWGDDLWHYNSLNALLCEWLDSGGDYCIEGMLRIDDAEPQPLRRAG